MVSRTAWHKYFAGVRSVEIGGRTIPIASVIPDELWRLPGRPDAWRLQDEPVEQARGFVIGRTPRPPRFWRWDLSLARRRFECVSLEHPPPFWAAFLMIGLALVILPATVSLHRGDYPHGTKSPFRWVFLAVKMALILPLVYCAALDLASVTALGLLPQALLIGYLLTFRWALDDQRRRCPVCLRLLGTPTRIGRPSQTFLSLWGTELLCGQGHGLLRIPEIPSISSSMQRWLTVEQAWSSLYS